MNNPYISKKELTEKWKDIEKYAQCHSHGYMCESCEEDSDKILPFISSLRHSDIQSHIEWAKEQKRLSKDTLANDSDDRRRALDDFITYLKSKRDE